MVTIKLQVSTLLPPTQVTLTVGGFTNPTTSLPITGVQVYLVDSSGNAKAVTQFASISGFTPARIQTAALSLNQFVVGASGVTLTVSMVVINIFKSTYQLNMLFPQWNPSSSTVLQMLSTSGLACAGVTNMQGSLTCSYSTTTLLLTVTGVSSSDIPAGSTMTFTVNNFQNPQNGIPKGGFQVTTYESTGLGMVDQTGQLYVTTTQFATLLNPTLVRADSITTVGQQLSLTIGFQLNLPIDAACIIQVVFPSDQPATLALNKATGTNLFSSASGVGSLDIPNSLIQVNGCSTYQDASVANILSTITFGKIVNKAYIQDTSPFIFQLFAVDSNGMNQNIAQITSASLIISTNTNPTLSMLTAGTLSYFKLAFIDSSSVGSFSTFRITMTPVHGISSSNQIAIQFPPGVTGIQLAAATTSNCKIYQTTGGMSQSATCYTDTVINILYVNNAFGKSSYSQGGAALSFIFNTGGTNPNTACNAGDFTVQTFAVVDDVNYMIDSHIFDATTPVSQFVPYVPTPGVLVAAVGTPTSTMASNQPTSYTFTITPQSLIPQGSSVQVIFPSTIYLQTTVSQVACTSVVNGQSTLMTVTPTSTSPLTFTLTKVFLSGAYSQVGTSLTITCSNLVNPRNLIATTSFSISMGDTTSTATCAIASLSTDMSIQMTTLPTFTSVTVTSSNVYNGGIGVYTITIVADLNLYTTDIFYITFPPEVTLPSSPSCTAGSSLSQATCTSPSSNTLKVVLKFSSSPLQAGTAFTFTVTNVKNPSSTKISSGFSGIQAFDSTENLIATFSGTAPTVKNLSPASATGTLSQYDNDVGVANQYTIVYTTINSMVAGATFQITYPSNIVAISTFTVCQVTFNTLNYPMTCALNPTTRTITMTAGSLSGLLVPTAIGSSISLQVSPLTNPPTQQNPVTLTMTSFTDDKQTYSYDQVPNGLIPTFKCLYPCASCASSATKSTCLSCFVSIAGAPKYLSVGKCLTSCPAGYYGDPITYQCTKCPENCLTCTSATSCSTCPILPVTTTTTSTSTTTTTSTFPYLYKNWCYGVCPDGYYPDSTKNCQLCDSNCLTCGRSSTNCTTCTQSGSTPFLSNGQCVNTCLSGTVSQSYVCQPCKAPCLTCVTSVDQCITCKTGFLYGTTCLATCPSGFTTNGKVCLGCDPKCQSCSPTQATKCLQCLKPLILLNNTCISRCPDGYQPDSQGVYCFATPIVPIIINNGTGGKGNGTTGSSSSSPAETGPAFIDPNANKIYVYGATTIAQTVTGGVAVGSQFMNPSSQWHSNVLGMWGPIQLVSFGAQAYLSYNQLASLEPANYTNSTNSTGTNTTSKRNLMDFTSGITSSTNGILPLVLYGTAFSIFFKFLCNIIFCMFFITVLRKDPGYVEFEETHRCHPWSVLILSSLFSFKIHKFLYSRFMGLDRFYIPFENPEKIHSFFNILNTLNIVFSLLPMILIDVYGLAKYSWGNQFYMMLIETLIFSLSTIAVQFFEYRSHKTFNPYLDDYSQVKDNSEDIEALVRQRLGEALDEYARRLKQQQQGEQPIRRINSMCDIGDRTKEEDPRRVNTEPLDQKKKKQYEDRMNPYHQVLDHDFPDNVYAEVGRNLKSSDGNNKGVIQQTGQRIMSAEEYERDLDSRMRMMSAANMRGDQGNYGQFGANNGEGDSEYLTGYKKKKNMRGRKGKYYSQVDDEDQNFLEQERRLQTGGMDEEDDDDEDRLGMIEEESQHSTQRKHSEEDTKLLLNESQKASPQGSVHTTSPRVLTQMSPRLAEQNRSPQSAAGKQSPKLPSPRELQKLENQILQEQQQQPPVYSPRVTEQNPIPEADIEHEEEDQIPLQLLEQAPPEPIRQSKNMVQLHQSDERDIDEDDILDDKEVVMNRRLKALGKGKDLNTTSPDAKNTESMKLEIDKMTKKLEEENQIIKDQLKQQENGSETDANTQGEPDSDDDESKRMDNIRDAEKRKFNVNDILGDFDRDERGHPLILQDKKGELIDKIGSRVNEKGYLVDPKTGDIVEREQGRQVFKASELDEKGELPPPFNLERFNFNGHDVRGHFDRDPKTGQELMNMKRDKQGYLRDKLGRRVNEMGWLIGRGGQLQDKRERTKLHKHIMEQNGGELPQLFTYKGKKFDLKDVMGALDKDRKGHIIIRRDAKGKMVDKLGRSVNSKGYLVDKEGNVINGDGKVMFDNYTVSKDGEIPKLFSFLKFNLDEVSGDYEMDPLGNPMLQKNREGTLVDSKGKKVNDKGYLIDDQGNVVNKSNQKVFNKNLLEEDGEVPKVFRAGLLRKDTYDSFSQLMSEIEDLERLQEMEEAAQQDPTTRDKMKRRMEKENERMQKKIDKIVEGGRANEEDEHILMKELEELANGNVKKGTNQIDGRHSDGGNTSVDSMMEDTPSNYNALNQRFMEVEAVKNQAKRNMRAQQQVAENEDEDEDASEYSYLPDRKLRKKKKKKKKKKRAADGTIDERELMMAKAYGGLSQSQYDKLVALKKLQASQLPPAARVESSQMNYRTPTGMQSIQGLTSNAHQQQLRRGQDNETANRFNEDQRSDWEESQGPDGRAAQIFNRKTAPGESSMSRTKIQGNSTSRMNVANKPQMMNNNLMGIATQRSGDRNADGSEISENNNMRQHMPRTEQQNLANIANSVSGFYKDHGHDQSEHSNMSRTQDNFASNLIGTQRLSNQDNGVDQAQRGPGGVEGRIYGTGNRQARSRGMPGADGGQGDFPDNLSDWEKQSHRSGRSMMSHFSQFNAMKVKGLETIYLQRLEPATKNRKKPGLPPASDKAKFRVMHHRMHDEPEWHAEDRDELDSIISGNYKEMQKKFEEEFQPSSHGTRSRKAKKIVQKSDSKVFSNNLKNLRK